MREGACTEEGDCRDGCTVPDALTFSVIEVFFAFANSTSMVFGLPIHPCDRPTTNNMIKKATDPIMIYSNLFDFRFCFAIGDLS